MEMSQTNILCYTELKYKITIQYISGHLGTLALEFDKGTHVLQASSYEPSLWTRTARVATRLNEEKKDYFLNVGE